MKAAHPDALPIAGGTDVMVEINFDRHRPPAFLDLTRVAELDGVGRRGRHAAHRGRRDLHAGHRRARRPAARAGDGLAHGRVAADPQPRHRRRQPGFRVAGGRRASRRCSPRDAVVELASVGGTRRIPVREFFAGPKRNAMRKDELIAAFLIEPARGPQQFSKVGTRNAMVIAVCSFGLAIEPERRRVGTGIGSAAPTPVTAPGGGGVHRRACSTSRTCGRRGAGVRIGRSLALASSSRPPRGPSTTSAAPRPTGGTRSPCWRGARFTWAWNEYRGSGMRIACTVNGGRASPRTCGRGEPAVRAARAPGPPGLEERLRAGRVRLVLGLPGRQAWCAPAWCSAARRKVARW